MDDPKMAPISNFPNPLTWQFMNEPLWRWLVFIIAMNLLLAAWVGVLRFMRD